MASHAQAYDSSDELKSAKFALSQLDASPLKPSLARTLRFLIVRSQMGPDLWAPTFAVSMDAGFSYRTVQRHIDRLERMRILRRKHAANVRVNGRLRRPATYVLHSEAGKQLAPRETYEQWRKRTGRLAPPRFRAHSVREMPPRPAPAVNAPLPAPAAKEPTRRERQEIAALVRKVRELMHGQTSIIEEFSGLRIQLHAKDPRYLPPVPFERALIMACGTLGLPERTAREWLKLVPGPWQTRE